MEGLLAQLAEGLVGSSPWARVVVHQVDHSAHLYTLQILEKWTEDGCKQLCESAQTSSQGAVASGVLTEGALIESLPCDQTILSTADWWPWGRQWCGG